MEDDIFIVTGMALDTPPTPKKNPDKHHRENNGRKYVQVSYTG